MIGPRRAIGLGIVAPMLVLCALGWRHSMGWPATHDLPIMMYAAFLMDRFAFLPHADFFDMNLLGSYAAYLGIGKTFGYTASALRWADLTVFAVIGSLTLFAFRPLGRLSGWLTVALFGIAYLRMGPVLSLQREYLLLVPMLAAFAIATRAVDAHRNAMLIACGAAVGLAATIKPQAVVMAVPLFLFFVGERRATTDEEAPSGLGGVASCFAWLGFGIVIPLASMAGVLGLLGVFDEFRDIAGGYLPLYGAMTGGHRIVAAAERPSYLLDAWFLFAPRYPWVLGASMGAAAYFAGATQGSRERRLALLVVGLALAFSTYPVFSGQFWNYHWLPYVFWLIAVSSLAFVGIGDWRDLRAVALPLVLVLIVLLGMIRPDRNWGRLFSPHFVAEGARPSQISDFLVARLTPGDTVQGMDWTNTGVIHALLRAEARPATSFLYDFHFYHHISTDYIQSLRRRFISELDDSDARFVVRGKAGPYPIGEDTSTEFPEFESLLARDYERRLERPGYDIYEFKH